MSCASARCETDAATAANNSDAKRDLCMIGEGFRMKDAGQTYILAQSSGASGGAPACAVQ